MIPPFTHLQPADLRFGIGSFSQMGSLLAKYDGTILLLTGGNSFTSSPHWNWLQQNLSEQSTTLYHLRIHGEPSPMLVDDIVAQYHTEPIKVVVSIGGGSVIDTGKAVSAMLPLGDSVVSYLEGVGDKSHPGIKVPFIAVPTTAGTGSEATKNAVLGMVGPDGYKRSLRHNCMIPDVALIDPELTLSCPPDVTAACAMDALTQLLEAYTSTQANAFTDALAWSGLEALSRGLPKVCSQDPNNLEARTEMSYAALLSGITLANAGLGVVHGLASPLGGYFDIPHGVVCGTLVAEATEINIYKILRTQGSAHPALEKYSRIGNLLSGEHSSSIQEGCNRLIQFLRVWVERLNLPRLSSYGISETDLPRIIKKAGIKNNPATLETNEIEEIVRRRL